MYHNFFSIFSVSLLCHFWQSNLLAQVDTTLSLPKVEVSAKSIRNLGSGDRVENWDSLSLNNFAHGNIGEILEQESGVFVKNFGPGSLATVSSRGGSAGQTAVLWNGLPIQSPMLGLLDLSLLPTDLTDQVNFRLGGNSSLWGSGAIGGVISLENQASFNKSLSISAGSTAGSFGRLDQSIKLEKGNQKWGFSSTVVHQNAANDFTFKLSNGDEKKLSNAGREQLASLQELNWKINRKNELSLHSWWQKTKREIPPTAVQNRSEATQEDEVLRLALHWKRIGESSAWIARFGFFQEEIDFRDPLIQLEAISHFWSVIGDVEGRYHISGQQKITVGISQMLTRAFADEYKEPPTESQSSLFVTYAKILGQTEFQFALRQPMIDGDLMGFSPSFSLAKPLSKHLNFRAKISRNYRLPTLNDRFWNPGGNSSLKPENGWSQEISLNTPWLWKNIGFEHEVTVFNRNIGDWILWSPTEGANFWSAQNLSKVWSRGIEQRMDLTIEAHNLKYNFNVGYDLIRSTNEVALELPKIDAGTQLIYVPVHQAFAGLSVHLNHWKFSYLHRLVSEFRAPNTDLEGHHLGYFRSAFYINRRKFRGSIQVKVENVWNADYRVVERRPMPGRNFLVGLKLNFKQSKN